MSHEFETGFFTKRPAWHGLGTVLEEAPQTSTEAIKEAGLDWAVKKQMMYLASGAVVPGAFALVRETDDSILGTVGNRFEILQNEESFDFFDPLIESGIATYETAGSLQGGSKIWVLAKINGDIAVGKDDVVKKYVLLSNSHDGKASVTAKITPIRVVCQNTLSYALRKKTHSGDQVRVRHTKNVAEKTKAASMMLKTVNEEYDKLSKVWSAMASIKMPPEKNIEYVQTVFPNPESVKNPYKTLAKRAEIHQLMSDSSLGGTLDGAHGTLWGAYNAVTAHADHFVSKRKDSSPSSHLDSAWFGSKNNDKIRAFSVAMDFMKREGISL